MQEVRSLMQLKIYCSHHVTKRVTATAAAPIEKQRRNMRFPFSDFAVIDRRWKAYADIPEKAAVPTILQDRQSNSLPAEGCAEKVFTCGTIGLILGSICRDNRRTDTQMIEFTRKNNKHSECCSRKGKLSVQLTIDRWRDDITHT